MPSARAKSAWRASRLLSTDRTIEGIGRPGCYVHAYRAATPPAPWKGKSASSVDSTGENRCDHRVELFFRGSSSILSVPQFLRIHGFTSLSMAEMVLRKTISRVHSLCPDLYWHVHRSTTGSDQILIGSDGISANVYDASQIFRDASNLYIQKFLPAA